MEALGYKELNGAATYTIRSQDDDCVFQIFIDNYLKPVKLLRYLSSIGICCSATIREGRTENCPLRSIPIIKN